MKKLFLLLVTVLSVGLCASAQTRTVTGVVIDASSEEPLIGASVTPSGSSVGVSTDYEGEFTIVVPANVTTLTVSYVGYETEHVAVGSGKLVVRLRQADNTLNELVAIGYGTVKRSEYTGSASVVKADQLEDALVSNVASALTGKASGVQTFSYNGQPGSEPTVRIRGTGSINASSSPLYVVDGVPYQGNISNINTMDVESMTVLKDAASTAIYGARGANGVILITTKRGREGSARITLDARWGSNSRAIPNYDRITDTRQYLETYYQAMYHGQQFQMGVTSGNAEQAAAAHNTINNYINKYIWSNLGYQIMTVPEGQNLFDTNGKINPYATMGYSDGRYFYTPDNWDDETYINGLRQEYNVSLTGGTERLQYYISAAYLSDEGIIKNSHFQRFSTRASVDYQAKKWLKIGSSMSYVYSDTSSPRDQTKDNDTSSGNAFYFTASMAPIYPFYVRNADGSIMWNSNYNQPIMDYGDANTDYGNGVYGHGRVPNGNPVGGFTYDVRNYLRDIFDGKWYAILTPVKGLTLTENVGYYVNNTRSQNLYNGVYGQWRQQGGAVYQTYLRYRDVTLQSLINYDLTIADVHDITLMAGYESEDYSAEDIGAQGDNLYQPQVPYVDNTIDNRYGGGSRSELSHRGFFFRGKYTYDGKYYFYGSVRRDGSSRFHPDHRWGTFWSLSAGWDIAREKFMEQFAGTVDQLKFKVSFGQNGNDGIGNSTTYMPYADFYTMTGSNGVFSDGTLAQKGNEEITWETSNAFNVGFDFSLWKGKLSGTVEYYNRQTDDMLFNLPVSPSLGYSSIPSNVGSMRNNGFEIDLNYQPVNTKDVTVDIFANVTFGWNKVLELDPSIMTEDCTGTTCWIRGTYQHIREGKSLYDLFMPVYAGVDEETGYALYYALDDEGCEYKTPNWNEARTTDSKYFENCAPLCYGGFGVNVEAKGIDFSMSFSYQLGGRMIDYGYQDLMGSGSSIGALHKDALNAWTINNTQTSVPKLFTAASYSYSNAMSDRWLTSSNYLSLNNITLGYTLPKKFTSKLHIDGVRIYAAAENIAVWSARKGFDPRQGLVSSSNYTYSPVRAISGGINVKF